MPFDADDLKRLKYYIGSEYAIGIVKELKFTALLARLEAAEKAARWFNSLKVDDENSEPYKDYLAWRKSCGSEK